MVSNNHFHRHDHLFTISSEDIDKAIVALVVDLFLDAAVVTRPTSYSGALSEGVEG